MGILQIFTLLGALGMFLYGMNLMSSGLQKTAGHRLRKFLEAMTSNSLKRYVKLTLLHYNKDTDEVLRIFDSLTEAAHYLNKNRHTNISACANGKTKTAYGYKWKFI